jgi:hypothetical protein
MKKMKLILIFILATFCNTNAQKNTFSKEVLAVTLSTDNDKLISFQDILSKQKGKIILIDIWTSHDPDFIKAIPKTKQLQIENPFVEYIFIYNGKKTEEWKAAISRNGLKGDHYYIPKESKGIFFTALDIDRLPRFMIVNPSGQIVLYRGIETDIEKMGAILKI